ncbi:MerR family transcriptional regulator [Neolewinella lacunae]|nr:MerR family transcriptional regulator [Neolewinella lacunae]MDN3637018.1 MerR family transcriptional regulator [Neolewinella lacunae]
MANVPVEDGATGPIPRQKQGGRAVRCGQLRLLLTLPRQVREKKLTFLAQMHRNMAKEERDDDLKLYYSIGEVAERLGVNASQIRFWDKEFPHLKPSKNSRGERRFTKENIRQLEEIHHLLKDRGFTIEGARKAITNGKKTPAAKEEVIERLLAVRQRLQDLLK